MSGTSNVLPIDTRFSTVLPIRHIKAGINDRDMDGEEENIGKMPNL